MFNYHRSLLWDFVDDKLASVWIRHCPACNNQISCAYSDVYKGNPQPHTHAHFLQHQMVSCLGHREGFHQREIDRLNNFERSCTQTYLLTQNNKPTPALLNWGLYNLSFQEIVESTTPTSDKVRFNAIHMSEERINFLWSLWNRFPCGPKEVQQL